MIWRRVLWTIQLVVFVTAGLFVTPIAGLQNATGRPVASAPHRAERVVASRERSGERAGRVRSDRTGDALAITPLTLPVVARAGFVVEARRVPVDRAPRRVRFEPYAPRGPPQAG